MNKKNRDYSNNKISIKLACQQSAKNRSQKRLDKIQENEDLGRLDIGDTINKRDLLILGVGLYWGEGYKNGNGEFGFTNSDPEMIKTFLSIIKNVYNISIDQLVFKISINKLFLNKIQEIEKYWFKITGVKKDQFTKTTMIKSKLNKKYNEDKYKGTLRIKVQKGEYLKRRILSSTHQLFKNINSNKLK